MTCTACASASLILFQAGCAECHIRHTAILHPDERTRRYEQVGKDKGHAAMVEFVGKVNRARQQHREKRK
jgi:hypothetical protein